MHLELSTKDASLRHLCELYGRHQLLYTPWQMIAIVGTFFMFGMMLGIAL